MPRADQYEPGDEPTDTSGRGGAAKSATGQNPEPDRRAIGEDTIQGTTSAVEPRLRGKPGKGSRLDPDA